MSEEEKIHFDGGMAEEKKRERRKREKEACFHLLAHVPNVHKSRC